jgi:hypothetical protein
MSDLVARPVAEIAALGTTLMRLPRRHELLPPAHRFTGGSASSHGV